jgi:predicted enzyme related to lactoylglutathione lyase
MITNRSVPTDVVLPHVVYQSVEDAIVWLSTCFGFVEHYHYGEPGGPISGAQMHLENAWIMIRKARDGSSSPSQIGCETQSLTVFAEDVDGHYQRTKASGAKIVEELHETPYGERQYGVVDLDGHHWLFSRHTRDVSPEGWGATKVSEIKHRVALLPRPSFCYLEIPAVDVKQSVAFYEGVFGWNIRRRDTAHPSFDDAAGNLSGAWVTGREAAGKPGLLPYIWVDSIESTLGTIGPKGGTVVEGAHPDNPGSTSHIATFRDPAGNLMGLYQEDAG